MTPFMCIQQCLLANASVWDFTSVLLKAEHRYGKMIAAGLYEKLEI